MDSKNNIADILTKTLDTSIPFWVLRMKTQGNVNYISLLIVVFKMVFFCKNIPSQLYVLLSPKSAVNSKTMNIMCNIVKDGAEHHYYYYYYIL